MRQGRGVMIVVAFALVLSAIGAAAASAGELPAYDGAMTFPAIKDSTGLEDYSWEVELHNGQTLASVSPTEAEVSGPSSYAIVAERAHDAHGTEVPTTLEVSAGDVITLVVHHREAPYVYPVTSGIGAEGGYPPPLIIKGPPDETELREMREAEERSREVSIHLPEPAPFVPAPCAVPSLHGLSLKTAKAWLRAANCGVGGVHLAAGATAGKGQVVKQFRSPGAQLEAGTPVGLKLGEGRTRARVAAAVASSAGEGSDSAEIVNESEGGTGGFPDIHGPGAPEEYPVRYDQLSPELVMRQVDDQEVVVEYKEFGVVAGAIKATPAHDAEGATVPTTVKLTEGNVVTLTVHYRAGNPAAGGAPFVYPIINGKGWEGGYRTSSSEMNEPKPPAATPAPAPAPAPCKVPSLHGLSLKTAKARLRAAHCAIGQVRLAGGATAGKGKVVKQFRPAGAQLAAGAAVTVKLGAS